MGMATMTLYKNPYAYPDYGSITQYGSAKTCTPIGMGLRNGVVRVEAQASEFMSCNYIKIVREGSTIYGWITDVEYLNDLIYNVHYSVDAFRTYKSRVDFGTQFIARSPEVTYKRDEMLGSKRAYPIKTTKQFVMPNSETRTFVLQIRDDGQGANSNTPVQPSPHQIWLLNYPKNNWTMSQPLIKLMMIIKGAKPKEVVTMYTIPYMNISSLPSVTLSVGGDSVDGFKLLGDSVNTMNLLNLEKEITLDENIDELMRVDHSVKLVVPEAGVIDIPDDMLKKKGLKLRQDIDLFSGASNYMLVASDGYYTQSIRGSSVSSIPIISDPEDTYLSQNQNALSTSLIGDVASIGMGVAMAGASGGIGAIAGAGAVTSGLNGIVSRKATAKDMAEQPSNPPAFLGTALNSAFGQSFWVVVTREHVDNSTAVHNEFGYPIERVQKLVLPNKGYIKTEGCTVSSDGTVPMWAVEEINKTFNNGIHIK